MSGITCVVVTPEQTALETTVDFVVVPLHDGEIGIGVNHSPMIGRLGYGELRIGRDQPQRYYIDGGFVQVEGNTVSVLTNSLTPVAGINVPAAEELLKEASKLPTRTDEELDLREQKVQQARAQLRMASR